MAWVIRNLECSGYIVEQSRALPIRYGARFINGQLDVCVRKLKYFQDQYLAAPMRMHIESVRAKGLAMVEKTPGGIRFGEDYVVCAR